MRRLSIPQVLFLLISIGCIILNLLDIIYAHYGKHFCSSEGCLINHTFDKHNILPWLGVIFFSVITLLSYMSFKAEHINRKKIYGSIIIVLLSTALGVEGYFISFQTFFTYKYCQFCLADAQGFFVLFLLGIPLFWKDVKREIAFVLGPLTFFALLIASSIVRIPLFQIVKDNTPVIVYRSRCPHCKNLIWKLERKNIHYKKISFSDASSLLMQLGIKEVPVVIKREDHKYIIAVGEKEGYKLLREKAYTSFLLPSESSLKVKKEENTPFGMCSIIEKTCH